MAQTLPGETLHEETLHALPSLVTSHVSNIDPFTIAPLNFSAVCRSWNEVVESEPDLWSSIHIEQENASKPFDLSVIRFVQTWLKKSDSAFLDIRLRIFRIENDRIFNKLYSELLNEVLRWEYIDINIFDDGPLEADFFIQRLPIGVKCYPMAKSLRLKLNACRIIPHAYVDLSDCCPSRGILPSQLRELSLCRDLVVYPTSRSALSFPNLRDLSLEIDRLFVVRKALDVLAVSPNLEVLKVVTYESDSLHSPSSPSTLTELVVHLLKLTQLSIESCNDTTPYQLLDNIRCPSLESFAFRVFLGLGFHLERQGRIVKPQYLDHLTDFFRRSCGEEKHLPLTDLSIGYSLGEVPSGPLAPYARALEDILVLCGDLERLELRGMVVDDEVIKALTLGEGITRGRFDAPLCPILADMMLVCEIDFGMQEESVAEMIVSRWRAEENLEAITFSVPVFNEFGRTIESVMECIRDGLEFHYNPGTPKIVL